MKTFYKPYGIDVKYEIKTYLNVGKDYGDAKTANKGWFINVTRFLRKKRNLKRKTYASCNTYSEWERHVESVLNRDILNYSDFLHWLYLQKREEEKYLDAVKIILIPIYMVLISVSSMFGEGEDVRWTVISMISSVMICSLYYLHGATRRVQFYEDFITIAEEKKRK